MFNRISSNLRSLIRRQMAAIEAQTADTLKRPVSDVETNGDVPVKKPREDFQRVKRRKFAVLLSYSGLGYLGLQRNPGMKTIEEDLLKAMLKSEAISDEAFNQPQIIEFQRAARTDKGVSALKQVLSLKLPLEVDLDLINSFLPEQIRMFAVKRATKGFNCKSSCDARTYSYMMPTFALSPADQTSAPDYRISPEIIDRTNEVLKNFVGTKNFHNFTSKKRYSDPSASRYIMSFVCEQPVLCDGMEFVTVKIKGQSFMLHQIRKMVGLVIAIVRGLTTEETIGNAWGETRLDLPMAPSPGLVLEEVHYDYYNQRYSRDGIHDAIEWSTVNDKLEDFRMKFILPSIVKAEKEDHSMKDWLETLPLHTYGIRNHERPSETSGETVGNEETKENENSGKCD